MPPSPLSRLRKLCLALPEAHEVEAWGEPTFRVKNKIFAMYAHANNHDGGGRQNFWRL
jgi:predicted DNA-binding protein (MmcQ/YjbR family)